MAQEKATEAQKIEAKSLGIAVANGVGTDTLQKKIDEVKAEFEGLTAEEIAEKQRLAIEAKANKKEDGFGSDEKGRKILAKGNGYKVVLNKKK